MARNPSALRAGRACNENGSSVCHVSCLLQDSIAEHGAVETDRAEWAAPRPEIAGSYEAPLAAEPRRHGSQTDNVFFAIVTKSPSPCCQ
jgi:hypothetical protein